MRMQREFDVTQVTIDHKLLRGFKIVCGRCGGEHKEAVGSSANNDGQEHVRAANKFIKSGWLIGKRNRDDRCRACVSIEAKEKINMNGKPAVFGPAPPLVPLPRVPIDIPKMQREDRRIIFEKLNDVYADESTGYGPGWTDKKVAEDLSVPRQWVETIREENFGPVRTNPEIADAINEANKVLERARELVKAVQAAKAALANALKPIEEKMGPIQALLDRTERSIAALEKSVG